MLIIKPTKNYCCMDCGCLICSKTACYGGGRCYSCSSSGDKNNCYTNGDWCDKHFCVDCNKKISYNSYRFGTGRCTICAGKYFSNKNRWNWKGGKPKCKDCGILLKSYSSIYCNKCKGKYIKKWRKRNYIGKNNPMYGKVTKSKRLKYKNICFRSSWESNFAKWCDGSGIKWQYEPKTFDLGETTYTPDFYLPEFDLWIEIKGWWKERDIIKKNLFENKYSYLNIIYLMETELKEMSIINK